MAARAKGFNGQCQVCRHDDCATINLALARGATVPVIRTKWPALSPDALYRHHRKHIPGPVLERLKIKSLGSILGKSLNVAELTDSENQSLLSQIVALKSSLLGALSEAERADAGQLYSSLAGRLTKLIEVEARILGQIQTGSTTTINNYLASGEYVALRSAMIEALRPYPQAAIAVARRLLALEAPKADIIDVESNLAGDAQLDVVEKPSSIIATLVTSPASEEAGGREAVPLLQLAQAAEVVLAPHDLSVRDVPAVIRTESYIDGATTERDLNGTSKLSR